MGTAYLYGNGGSGGGSGGFGLQIVEGLVRPKNPTQGMIWAKTEHKVTYYDLSDTKPENPVDGTLWVSISDSGDRKIVSPISKEWVTVYPLYAEQYISGKWMSIETMSYQDGEWVGWWNGELFVNGDTNDYVTGGLKAYAYKSSTSGSTAVALTITNDNGIMKTSTVGSLKAGAVFVENAIDITKFNALEINVTQRTGQTGAVYFGVTKTKENGYALVAGTAIDKTGKTTLDLSGLSGEYYCLICLAGNGDKQVSFDEWKLVR